MEGEEEVNHWELGSKINNEVVWKENRNQRKYQFALNSNRNLSMFVIWGARG